MNFHFVFLIIGILTIAGTLTSLRREHIRTEYSFSWLFVGLIVTAFALFPSFLEGVAAGLELDPQMFFVVVAGTLISAVVFEISHVVSRLRDENVILAQKVAILEFRIEHANERIGPER